MSDQLSADLASLKINRDERPRSRGWWKGAVALVLVAGAYVGARPAWRALESKLFQTEVGITEVALVSPAEASIELTSTGYIVPQTTAKVGAKVGGRISKVNVKEGDHVKAGDVLVVLEEADQKSAVAAARARVAAANARAQTARATLSEAEVKLERSKKLVASGALAASEVDDLAARVNSLKVTVTAADAETGAAAAEVNAATIALANLTIASPIDGTVVTKPAGVGDIVAPAASPVLELADFNSLLVETDVPEARLHLVKKDAPTEIILDAFPEKRFRGSVVEVSPRLNRAKATATIKVKFVDETKEALPEMSARVSFLAKPLDASAMKDPPKRVVPASALVDRGGAKAVFVVDSGKVRLVVVTLGGPFAGGFELKEGPNPGTRIVNNPPSSLVDGQAVKEKSS